MKIKKVFVCFKAALYRAAWREIADVPIDPPSLLGLGMFGLSRRWPTQAVLYSAALTFLVLSPISLIMLIIVGYPTLAHVGVLKYI